LRDISGSRLGPNTMRATAMIVMTSAGLTLNTGRW